VSAGLSGFDRSFLLVIGALFDRWDFDWQIVRRRRVGLERNLNAGRRGDADVLSYEYEDSIQN